MRIGHGGDKCGRAVRAGLACLAASAVAAILTAAPDTGDPPRCFAPVRDWDYSPSHKSP